MVNSYAVETRRFTFRRWSSREETVDAASVEFLPGGGLAFWTADRLVLAVKENDWNDLREVDRVG